MTSFFYRISFLWMILGITTGFSQSNDTLQLKQRVLSNAQVETYKRVGSTDLRLSIIYPVNQKSAQPLPAIVFFFGGGWKQGSVHQFEPHSRYLASRGMIAIVADYRVESRQGTTPVEAVQDAKSAMRYVRKNAVRLGIDPDQLVAGGGSAGGHLALATAMLPGLNELGEDTTVNTRPAALVLYNPVVRTLSGGYGYERLSEKAQGLSPDAHVRAGLPPLILFHGTDDTTVTIKSVVDFCQEMEAAGNKVQLHKFPGQKHGFFNFSAKNPDMYNQTLSLTDDFLTQLGFLKSKSTK